jgi:2-methylcitrate dehydratase PrpD
MNETRELAQFVSEIVYNDLNNEVIDKAKGLILDQLGCQLAFASLPWSQAVYRYIKSRKGEREESTIVIYGLKTTPEDAAFANGTFGYGFEMDDYDLYTLGHPGCVVIPSAFATGEMQMISGKELITAVVAGYEVMLRIGAATRSALNRWFFPTSVWGAFGAAAATSKVLGLNAEATTSAISIAAFDSGGVAEWTETGGSVVHVQTAFAVHSGMRAAFLSQEGITGPPTALEGKKGFCQAYANEYSPDEITVGLGEEFRILKISNKPYCCCAGLHSTIDAVSRIADEHNIIPEDIEEVNLATKPHEVKVLGSTIEPKDVADAQFSSRFGIALRLVKGGNGFKDYSPENVRDPEVLGLARRINHVVDEDLEKLPTDVVPARVTIRLKDGTVYQEQVNSARGTIVNPMTEDDLRDKFRGLAATVAPDDRVEKIIQTVGELEELDNIGKLGSLLVAD